MIVPLELELRAIVSHLIWMLGPEIGSLGRAAQALSHEAIFLAHSLSVECPLCLSEDGQHIAHHSGTTHTVVTVNFYEWAPSLQL